MSGLDAYKRPPEDLKRVFKKYQRITYDGVESDDAIVSRTNIPDERRIRSLRTIDSSRICLDSHSIADVPIPVFEWSDMPGLHYIPNLLTDGVQLQLLSCLLHRDLADARHKTNIHLHHEVPYGLASQVESSQVSKSFFNSSPQAESLFQPKNDTIHRPLTLAQILTKKLRWFTLGGQYNWTAKKYPDEEPPAFPADIKDLIKAAFPDMTPEAAIVNVYSPGDTLALHRDVSEVSHNGLVSISLGCEAIFIAGLVSESGSTIWRAFRLQSGDAIYMAGASRYAWHGVPKILKDTCPQAIRSWPAGENGQYEEWRDWTAGKRINLNVRQMFDA